MSPETAAVIVALIGVLGSGGLWTFLDNRKSRKTAQEQAQTDAIIALARIELVRESLRHIEKGSITMEEADALEDLFMPYTVLGGNGNGKRLYDQAMALPRQTGRRKERE
jgi:hypothetical protein